jgi:RHH-type proline utilization regulon transcriptional repressor/proline dehydrogenase/delta 1-pyrroline-5-carboxylate dehydrogenase
MEHYAIKDRTLAVFKRVLLEDEFRDWPDCGIVIQAYLRDALADLRELIAWSRKRGTPIAVRLVKGAYWDSEVARARQQGVPPPVFTEKWQSDVSFEQCARLMLENADFLRPAIGSHNVRSIAAVLATAQALRLPPRTVDLQMLTGMGEPLKRALVGMGQRVRIYAPVGDLVRGMAYLIRRLIENTSNDSFLRQSAGGATPPEVLLADPARHALGA